MPRHWFTLAALATSAVPGLDVATAQPLTAGGEGAFDAALVTAKDGTSAVVQVPTTPAASRALAAEAVALRAFTPGVRARLPFSVPQVLGSGSAPVPGAAAHGAEANALVTSYVAGRATPAARITGDSAIAAEIGAAIAAIHALPVSVVSDSGLPVRRAEACRTEAAQVIEAAVASDRVPSLIADRWQQALDDATIWRFPTTVVHGSITPDALRSTAGAPAPGRRHGGHDGPLSLTGLLHWGALAVGDPATDFAWTLALPVPGAADTIFDAYADAARTGRESSLRVRANLYAELELARWLNFGVRSADATVIDDAARMLDGLVQAIETRTAGQVIHDTQPVLGVEDVERLLAATSGIANPPQEPPR